ncbi:MAG: hypothetical protein ABI425_03775 [Patescibacteria group bacterium]
MINKNTLDQLHATLFLWWRKNGRVLPWREKKDDDDLTFSNFQANKDTLSSVTVRDAAFQSYFSTESKRVPYRVVVSEVMLQQTQVDRVLSKYLAWMIKWPSIEDLAKASLGEVIIEWKGLGYNRRARFLWLLAKEIIENRKGIWPESEKELLTLPGIGRYTARAVMSFAFGQQVGVVDTNVKRVFARIFNSHLSNFQENEKSFFQFADQIIPKQLADPWNQALMDFGALICTAKSPLCDACPVSNLCDADTAAKHEGFETYAAKLRTAKSIPHRPKKTKDYANGVALKFEQTDRFLRGRVLDLLREKKLNKKDLITILSNKFTQFNLTRITENIDRLISEEMIKEENKIISL